MSLCLATRGLRVRRFFNEAVTGVARTVLRGGGDSELEQRHAGKPVLRNFGFFG